MRAEHSMKVLVVDDSGTMQKIISRWLSSVEGLDTEVVQAKDGLHALGRIAEHGTSIDLILYNMNMPGACGLSLLRSLRDSPEFRRIPFVIVTADESDERTAQALREGAAGVLGKPFERDALLDLVRRQHPQGRPTTSRRFKTGAITRMIRTMSLGG
jgi:two-component system chemotaxis response regulator CheY